VDDDEFTVGACGDIEFPPARADGKGSPSGGERVLGGDRAEATVGEDDDWWFFHA
jgi:hypothetical protein